jgi:hypothetical protein
VLIRSLKGAAKLLPMNDIGGRWEGTDTTKEFTHSWYQELSIVALSDRYSSLRAISRLRWSALALWNFASGEPAKGRIPQGKSAVKSSFFRTFVFS